MDYSFSVEHAKKYGVNEAIILRHLIFWIKKNAANGRHVHDGRVWTYSSKAAFCEIFPFLNVNQIKYALSNLKNAGVIVTANYNNSAYDRTLWYAIADEGIIEECGLFPQSTGQNCPINQKKLSNQLDEIVQPIPDILQINTDTGEAVPKTQISPMPGGRKPRPAMEDRVLVDAIYARLRDRIPAMSAVDRDAWAEDVYWMRVKDQITHAEALKAFNLAMCDPFWCDKITSIRDLRRHYNKLIAKSAMTEPKQKLKSAEEIRNERCKL